MNTHTVLQFFHGPELPRTALLFRECNALASQLFGIPVSSYLVETANFGQTGIFGHF